MIEYSKVNITLKSAVKNQTEMTLSVNFKMFDWGKLHRELLLTASQKKY